MTTLERVLAFLTGLLAGLALAGVILSVQSFGDGFTQTGRDLTLVSTIAGVLGIGMALAWWWVRTRGSKRGLPIKATQSHRS